MPTQDIYKLVEELNKRKSISNDNKIDDIYNLLDEVKKENNKIEKPNLKLEDETSEKQVNYSSINESTKKAIKPSLPSSIRSYEKRSECFINIIQAVEYGDNNADYKKGHEDALGKYLTLANNNKRDFYVVEGQVNDELSLCKTRTSYDNYSNGYVDGLLYVLDALNKSKELIEKKINEKLLKELS